MSEKLVSLPSLSEDDKVVEQLDQVTNSSEEKIGEVFEKLEVLINHSTNVLNITIELSELIKKSRIKDKSKYEKLIKELNLTANNSLDDIEITMEMLQYQDLNRQKIERVINNIRGLSSYINFMFSSDIKDEDRVSSAQYIAGDSRDDLVSDAELEALLSEFGQ
jgi:hypothetical protein